MNINTITTYLPILLLKSLPTEKTIAIKYGINSTKAYNPYSNRLHIEFKVLLRFHEDWYM